MKEFKQEARALDFRLLDNSNCFFIGLLWLMLILQWKLISFEYALTFFTLLVIYSGVHFYNSVMNLFYPWPRKSPIIIIKNIMEMDIPKALEEKEFLYRLASFVWQMSTMPCVANALIEKH